MARPLGEDEDVAPRLERRRDPVEDLVVGARPASSGSSRRRTMGTAPAWSSSQRRPGMRHSVALATGEMGQGAVVRTRTGSTRPLVWFETKTRPPVVRRGEVARHLDLAEVHADHPAEEPDEPVPRGAAGGRARGRDIGRRHRRSITRSGAPLRPARGSKRAARSSGRDRGRGERRDLRIADRPAGHGRSRPERGSTGSQGGCACSTRPTRRRGSCPPRRARGRTRSRRGRCTCRCRGQVAVRVRSRLLDERDIVLHVGEARRRRGRTDSVTVRRPRRAYWPPAPRPPADRGPGSRGAAGSTPERRTFGPPRRTSPGSPGSSRGGRERSRRWCRGTPARSGGRRRRRRCRRARRSPCTRARRSASGRWSARARGAP